MTDISSIVQSSLSSNYESQVLQNNQEQHLSALKSESEELRETLNNWSTLRIPGGQKAKNHLKKRLAKIEATIDSIEQEDEDSDENMTFLGESLYVSDAEYDDTMTTQITSAETVNIGNFTCTTTIWNALFPFQKEGVKWLLSGFSSKVLGILADEMGLGKTIQMLSFLHVLHCSSLFNSCVILVPVSVLSHWERESVTWLPGVEVEVLHGSGGSTIEQQFSRLLKYFDSELEYDFNSRKGGVKNLLLITTYETFRLYITSIKKLNFQMICCDEGHRIKNPDASITLTIKTIETPLRLLLTGTPLMNSLRELWSLVDFCSSR
ncbi:hypothetical protein GEMRC1_003333 [Eukaryota sp. GEM-RC1]